MYADDAADASRWSHAWVVGVGLMLALTTMLPAAQAAALKMGGSVPCVIVSTNPPGFSIGECNVGGSAAGSGANAANDVLAGQHPSTSSSAVFHAANATAVGENVRVSWTINESAINTNVTAFHVQRGLDPTLPSTMDYVATTGPDAGSYVDEDAMASGEPWYVVTVELDDGSFERSEPFRVNNVQASR